MGPVSFWFENVVDVEGFSAMSWEWWPKEYWIGRASYVLTKNIGLEMSSEDLEPWKFWALVGKSNFLQNTANLDSQEEMGEL